MTFLQSHSKTNDLLSWNSDADSVIPSPKCFLPYKTLTSFESYDH